jgi:hypothetical protein
MSKLYAINKNATQNSNQCIDYICPTNSGDLNMFLLHLLPDVIIELVVNIILALGVIGTAITFFPILLLYQLPIRGISIILLAGGSYFKGGFSVEEEWQVRIVKLEQQLAAAEAAAHTENIRIETKIVERVKYVKEKTHAAEQTIQQNSAVINADCRVPDIARVFYNRAVNNEVSLSTGSSAATSTDTNSIKPEHN